MKNFKFCIAYLAIFAIFFTSCSKDEVSGVQDDPNTNMATISFGAVLNDFVANRAALKAPLTGDVPVCSDAAPVKVRVALKNSGGMWVAGKDGDAGGFIEIPVIPDGQGGWMTKESSDLELPEGMYSLEYFAVLDAGNNILWIAPRENDVYGPANFAAFVNDALPIAINLRVGVKKYIDVEVLCYDERFADEFGYLFFDFTVVDTITLCIFGNYCNEIGRHFPAKFSVEAWMYSGDAQNPKGTALTNEALFNETGLYQDPVEAFAKPLCFALPDGEEDNWYYIEISILDFEGVYDAPAGLKQTLVISDAEVLELYNNGTNTYYHFREGCEEVPPCNPATDADCDGFEDETDNCPNVFNPDQLDSDGDGKGNACDVCPDDATDNCNVTDSDGDGVIDSEDECPGTPPGTDVDRFGCEAITVPGRDVVVFNDINIFDNNAMEDADNVRLVRNLVTYTTSGSRNNGDVVMMDRGRNAKCFENQECNDSGWATMRTVIANEGFTISNVFSTSGSLSSIPANVKVMFLVMPTQAYTVEEINAFKSFAAQGGRLIFIGEWEGFYEHINVQNQFLLSMGAVLHNTGGALDCGYTIIPAVSNRVHPIMEGIDDLTIGCASVIEPGPDDFPLFYDTTNTHVLAGVAKIDSTPITELRPVNTNKRGQAPAANISNPSSSTGY
jgi:hypothetical protein